MLMPIRITGSGPRNGGPPISQERIRQGSGLHAGERITFDLDEIRDAGGLGTSAFDFSAIGTVNDRVVGRQRSDGHNRTQHDAARRDPA